MPGLIAPQTLDFLLSGSSTLALVDVREHGEYNAAHIPGASSLPRRLIEFRFERLVPCRAVQVVVCDDDTRRAALAAGTIEGMGYERVAVLDGGVNRWSTLGLATEWGINVPSKDFGERVEVEHHVPTIEASELARRLVGGRPVMILDTRTPEEYGQYCLPGARSVPGGELAYRIGEILAEQPDAELVINCAGRTRSIIGARILQRMGLPNVTSLRNGTSGWLLAGQELERGANRFELPEPSGQRGEEAEEFARRLAREDGVRYLSAGELQTRIASADGECRYLIDVRAEEEFAAGHVPGFWSFPGGQAVQRVDDVVAVRNATIVFCCDGRVRSTITASWYRQMGFPNVHVLDGGTTAWSAEGHPLAEGSDRALPFGFEEAAARARWISPPSVQSALSGARPPLALFVDTSREFAQGHPAGAQWLSRSWLEPRIRDLASDQGQSIIVIDTAGLSAPLAAVALADLGYSELAVMEGGMAAWREAGLPVERGLSGVMTPPDDVLPVGPERTYAGMVEYLRWEERLGQKYAPRS